MKCIYCEEDLGLTKGLVVAWFDDVPRSVFHQLLNGFCDGRCLYKYLALQLREPRLPVQSSSKCLLRVLTESGDFLIEGDSWERTEDWILISGTGGEIVAEFRQELVQGVMVEKNFLKFVREEANRIEQDQTQA